MGKFIGNLLDSESMFGRIMTRCGILIAANLMFLLFSLPVITTGPALAALYYTMLKVLRGDKDLNPWKTYLSAFRDNLKQGLLVWCAALIVSVILYLDIRFCSDAGGVLLYFKYALYALAAILIMLIAYLFPVMAAFSDTISGLLRNTVFFIARNPLKMLVIVFLDMFPLAVTYLDEKYRPLYVFLWAATGFSGIAMLVSRLLIRDFSLFLPDAGED